MAHDVAVIGAGPNGLAAALTMARAGLSVRLIERNDTVGGAARTRELGYPGAIHDLGSAVHPMAAGSPWNDSRLDACAAINGVSASASMRSLRNSVSIQCINGRSRPTRPFAMRVPISHALIGLTMTDGAVSIAERARFESRSPPACHQSSVCVSRSRDSARGIPFLAGREVGRIVVVTVETGSESEPGIIG